MPDYISYAQSPAMWMFSLAVMAVIVFQAVVFFRLAKQNAQEGHIENKELMQAMRAGAISAIGPSVAVGIVALSLIPIFGTPPVLMRIGMIGSVPYELAAANAAAESMNAPLGTENFDAVVFAAVFFTMALGAGVWMLEVVLATSAMGKMSEKLSEWKPWAMAALTGGALLGAFAFLTISQASGGSKNLAVMAGSSGAMVIFLLLSERLNMRWLREWALGFAMIIGLAVAYFVAA
ncbi:DUF5058 family protein [Corynebacterium coyleae]